MTTIHDISYTFSSIEKNEYEKIYQFLKNKKVNVKSSGKGKGGTLTWDDDDKVDHYLEGVKRDAEMESDDNSMSSDDTDFNPDALEALSAKEEYDSEPSSTDTGKVSILFRVMLLNQCWFMYYLVTYYIYRDTTLISLKSHFEGKCTNLFEM